MLTPFIGPHLSYSPTHCAIAWVDAVARQACSPRPVPFEPHNGRATSPGFLFNSVIMSCWLCTVFCSSATAAASVATRADNSPTPSLAAVSSA